MRRKYARGGALLEEINLCEALPGWQWAQQTRRVRQVDIPDFCKYYRKAYDQHDGMIRFRDTIEDDDGNVVQIGNWIHKLRQRMKITKSKAALKDVDRKLLLALPGLRIEL
eukprot:gb/GFBE01050748.1/.p1 GENE.gb/GFBE01050748.1/~~gb/GFBE01050748.1/.p1  ORF type:complete len:111 (+),score=6.39 gb/GFBE01050748.1/:1-333(+)